MAIIGPLLHAPTSEKLSSSDSRTLPDLAQRIIEGVAAIVQQLHVYGSLRAVDRLQDEVADDDARLRLDCRLFRIVQLAGTVGPFRDRFDPIHLPYPPGSHGSLHQC